jgi:hypothetical protein
MMVEEWLRPFSFFYTIREVSLIYILINLIKNPVFISKLPFLCQKQPGKCRMQLYVSIINASVNYMIRTTKFLDSSHII